MKELKDLTILIIDDSYTNIALLKGILEAEGYKIIIARSGKEALDVLEKQTLDLVLLDLMMPVIDGYTVLDKMRKNEKTKDLPVIVVSAKTDKESIAKAQGFNIYEYFTKPIDIQEFVDKIDTLFEQEI